MAGERIPGVGKTYTFRTQDVYVLLAIRIRSDGEGIGSISTTCDVGDLDAGGADEEVGRGGAKKGSTVGR